MVNSRKTSSAAVWLLLASGLHALPQEKPGQDQPLNTEQAKALKNPVPYSKKSITKGRGLYVRYSCTGCHGADGKATVDVVADATDLTSPKLYRFGTSTGELFRSIRDGQGASMPAYRSQIPTEDEMWHLVNFIYSLWPEAQRPALVEDKP